MVWFSEPYLYWVLKRKSGACSISLSIPSDPKRVLASLGDSINFSDQGKQLEYLGRGRFRPPQNSRNPFHGIKLDCRQSKLHETKLPLKELCSLHLQMINEKELLKSRPQDEVCLAFFLFGLNFFIWAQFQQSKDMMEATVLSQYHTWSIDLLRMADIGQVKFSCKDKKLSCFDILRILW